MIYARSVIEQLEIIDDPLDNRQLILTKAKSIVHEVKNVIEKKKLN
jgi:hypothetical protein